MFPVPSHLPRTGGDHISSQSVEEIPQNDPVYDFIAPLIANETSWTGQQIRGIREQLEAAIKLNKDQSHDLLTSNFPSISTHIQTGSLLQIDYTRIQTAITSLEKEIDPSSPRTSFLPPFLTLLNQHRAAQQSLALSESHGSALRVLKTQTLRIERLEEAVWAGRGADDWVIAELDDVSLSGSVLAGTQTAKDIETKLKLFKSMITEQVTDAFSKAVSFASPTAGAATMSVQTRTSLQQPRIPRTLQAGETAKPSIPPPYSLSQIYLVLFKLSALSSILQSLRNKILRDLITPVVSSAKSSGYKVSISKSDSLSILRLEPSERTASQILEDVSSIITFVTDVVFPSSPIPERDTLIRDLRLSALQAVLDNVILQTIPATLSSVPKWLEMVRQAVDFESSSGEEGSIKEFYDVAAGPAWVNLRRQRIAEEVRKLILSGWGGWEAIEKEREREMTVVVEAEEVNESVKEDVTNGKEMAKDDADFGWGFDDEPTSKEEEVDDGWGFDNAEAGPSRSEPSMETENGWDFDSPIKETVNIAPIPKPAREAKRLGKKVAKVKHVDDDPWHVEPEIERPSSSQSNQVSTSDFESNRTEMFTSAKSLLEPVDIQPPAPSKKVLKEVKKVLKEVYLVSRACDKLIEIAKRVLREIEDLRLMSLASSSFSDAGSHLQSSLSDIFDIYRSLLPIHFANQIQSVPTIAFQVYNDHHHLSAQISSLKDRYEWWDIVDLGERMRVAGDGVFENQLGIQLSALRGTLDECAGFVEVGTEIGFRRCEKGVKGVVHDLETLAKVLKTVLPLSMYLLVIGYLLDTVVQTISSNILSLDDITETESNRLNDLVKLVHPLDKMFVVEDGQPSTIVAQVPHWLKFCYISELLQANLIDITYLYDTGALVDFNVVELVNIIRALFADSPKRDAAIEKIEGVEK